MASLGELGRAAQDALGILGGGRSQVDAVGLSAKVGVEAGKLRGTILDNLYKFGAKVGPRVGGDFFSAVANGAQSTAAPAVEARQKELFGVSASQVKSYGLIAGVLAAVGLGVFLARSRHV